MKLRAYLNSLTSDEQVNFATACGTTAASLRVALSKKSKIGAELCVAIEQQSDGLVTRKELRPDDWQRVWPELVSKAFKHQPAKSSPEGKTNFSQ